MGVLLIPPAGATEDAEEDGSDTKDEAPKRKPVIVRREPFEVPMQGQFWLHDSRFDEAAGDDDVTAAEPPAAE